MSQMRFLLKRLPERMSPVIQKEYEAIINDKPSLNSNCTYFESCKATLNIKKLDVYPNPANQTITIEFNTPEKLFGNIALLNINGSVAKELLTKSTFEPGKNSNKFDILGISPGIYLISINTDKGFKTQRLVVSR